MIWNPPLRRRRALRRARNYLNHPLVWGVWGSLLFATTMLIILICVGFIGD